MLHRVETTLTRVSQQKSCKASRMSIVSREVAEQATKSRAVSTEGFTNYSRSENFEPNFKQNERLLRKSKILFEIVNNKSPSAVWYGRRSCRINMTVLLSFEEKTDDACSCP